MAAVLPELAPDAYCYLDQFEAEPEHSRDARAAALRLVAVTPPPPCDDCEYRSICRHGACCLAFCDYLAGKKIRKSRVPRMDLYDRVFAGRPGPGVVLRA